jgi:hypothetical protein
MMSASALEVGVQVGNDFSDTNRMYGGVTVSESRGPVSLTVGYNRTTVGSNNQNRWSLVGGYDFVKFGKVQITPTVGGAYLANRSSNNGFAMTVGAEASTPISFVKNLTGVVDYTYQMGQDRVNQFDGSRVSVGLRYKF